MTEGTLYQSIKALREDKSKVYFRVLLTGYFNQQIVKRQSITVDSYLKDTLANFGKKITGYLYIKGVFYLHLIQSDSMDHINSYLKSYSEIISKKKSLHNNTRIAYQCYESPVQFFKSWDIDRVDQPGPVLVETEKTEQQIADRTFEIYEFMEEGGKKVKENSSFKISNMLLLSNDDMGLLISNFYMSLTEYCQIYMQEIQSKKQAEDNYPLPTDFFNILQFMQAEDYQKFQL